MAYLSKDEQVIVKLRKYIDELAKSYLDIAKIAPEQLDFNRDATYVAMCVVQLYELTNILLNDAVRLKLFFLTNGQVRTFRNIFAHDYESFNWKIGKRVCEEIISKITPALLDECSVIAADSKDSDMYLEDDENM